MFALKIIRCGLIGIVVFAVPMLSHAFVSVSDYKATEFSPQRKQSFNIPVELKEKSKVSIKLYTVDGDLVRTIKGKEYKKGSHNIVWDGKDDKGKIVPDEVYIPVIEAVSGKGKKEIIDSRKTSGGEVDNDLQVKITADKHISYVLPAPSRVLIRAGIKSGPMMRSLANWEPRSAGKNMQRWDGMDESKVLDLRNEPGLTVLVTAFRLPNYAIITLGNDKLGYNEYRKKRGWPDRVVKQDDMVLARGNVRIARQHYLSPAQARDPRIKLSLDTKKFKKNGRGIPILKVGQAVPVKVEVNKNDRWLIDQSMYEVAFFIDHEFASEEEQGYLPLSWMWKVNELKPGQHIFTVNITAVGGKVGVVSQLFEIEK